MRLHRSRNKWYTSYRRSNGDLEYAFIHDAETGYHVRILDGKLAKPLVERDVAKLGKVRSWLRRRAAR